MLSRRSLLKYLGISAGMLAIPDPLPAIENVPIERIFNFKSFERWLHHVSCVTQENYLNSFRIFVANAIQSKHNLSSINIIASFDDFSRQEFIKKQRISDKKIKVVFQMESRNAPEDFVEQIQNKHGRMTLASWLTKGKFDRANQVPKFIEEVKKKVEEEGIYIGSVRPSSEIVGNPRAISEIFPKRHYKKNDV